jgi:CDP-glucose 4,6-dehydratase
MVVDRAAWAGRRVLLTGHTGFKGSWLALWLVELGAHVTGFSDRVGDAPTLFELVDHRLGDVRDREAVDAVVRDARPEVVLHLAAQPFVRRSFREPVETYATNVMGTVHVLDAVRRFGDVRATVIVTSDKCYDNRGQGRPFTEDDCMGGHDPYSNSKGAAELVTDAYRRSYELPVASGRAGNVIGGGDWGEDRLIPDMMRGALAGTPIPIRRPDAVRPWQHVLNPLSGYLLLAQTLAAGEHQVAEGWNFGPPPDDAQPVAYIVERLTALWPGELRWDVDPGPHPHEATYLALDSAKARERLGWAPAWDLEQTLASIVGWFVAYRENEEMRVVTQAQIDAFQKELA